MLQSVQFAPPHMSIADVSLYVTQSSGALVYSVCGTVFTSGITLLSPQELLVLANTRVSGEYIVAQTECHYYSQERHRINGTCTHYNGRG